MLVAMGYPTRRQGKVYGKRGFESWGRGRR